MTRIIEISPPPNEIMHTLESSRRAREMYPVNVRCPPIFFLSFFFHGENVFRFRGERWKIYEMHRMDLVPEHEFFIG